MNKRRKAFILALGSNTAPEQSLPMAKRQLEALLGTLAFTPILTTAAIGMDTAPFSNCLAYGRTDKQADELIGLLKDVERLCGDHPQLRTRQHIVMDIDLLLLGRKRYHPDDWERDYIRQLMTQPTSQ